MRIDFSSKLVRAALSVVFSTKTYSHIATDIARRALALMISLKNATWGPDREDAISTPKSPDSQKSGNVEEKSAGTQSETTETNDASPSVPDSTASRMLSEGLAKINQKSRTAADLTIAASRVIYDIIVPQSPLKVGVQTLQDSMQIIPIRGDGNCCFYSLSFGLLHHLQQTKSPIKEQLVKMLIAGMVNRTEQMAHSPSPQVREIIKSPKTAESIAVIEEVLRLFGASNLPAGDLSPDNWINENSENLPFIGALRYLTTLMGIHLQTQDGVELFEMALKEGDFGLAATTTDQYIEKICRFDPRKQAIAYGGDLEIQGFVHLFDVGVDIFSLSEIGDPQSAKLTPFQAIERGHMRFSPPHPHADLPSISLVHSRIHYDAALPKLQITLNDPSSSSSESDTSSDYGSAVSDSPTS